MTVIPTTQRPYATEEQSKAVGLLGRLNPSPIDFLQKKLKKYPFLKLKPNSLLAKAVIYQYTQGQKATTNRPEWPEELCGYIESVASQSDLDRLNSFNPKLNGIPDSRYPQDKCITPRGTVRYESGIYEADVALAVSLPGTLPYAKCPDPDLIDDLYDLDWQGYFSTDVFASVEDLTDKELAYLNEVSGADEIDDYSAPGPAGSAPLPTACQLLKDNWDTDFREYRSFGGNECWTKSQVKAYNDQVDRQLKEAGREGQYCAKPMDWDSTTRPKPDCP